jgi:hypothetical protein
LGDVWDFVYVDLDEVDVGEFLGESVFVLSVFFHAEEKEDIDRGGDGGLT